MNLLFEEISRDSDFYEEALKIRYDLFFKDHNLPWEILFDGDELKSRHFVLLKDENIVSYGRLTQTDDLVRFSQMVVASEFQSRGFGSILLRRMIEFSNELQVKEISLSARLSAVDFYSKQNFKTVGEVYKSKKTRVEHIEMVNDNMKDVHKIFSPENSNSEDKEILKECFECLQKFSDAFDEENLDKMDEQLHFPHYLFSGNEMTVWEKSGNMPSNFFETLKEGGFRKTICELAEPVLISPNKVHYKWNYTRRGENDTILSTHENLWIVTIIDGKWGIALRSY